MALSGLREQGAFRRLDVIGEPVGSRTPNLLIRGPVERRMGFSDPAGARTRDPNIYRPMLLFETTAPDLEYFGNESAKPE